MSAPHALTSIASAAGDIGVPVVSLHGGRVVLIQGDAFELLGRVPDQCVDLLLTDPPYNLREYSTGNIQMSWRKSFNNDIAEWDGRFEPSMCLDDFRRVLTPTGNLFAFTSYNLLGEWHRHFDPVFDTFQFIVWHKTNPPPKLYRAGFLNACELIVACWNKGHRWHFTKQNEMHNFIESPICMGRERLRDPRHPTQKPLKVLRRLVALATDAHDVILDPFMGVGSSGVAAVEMGRCFLGFEIEPAYLEAARERIVAVPEAEAFLGAGPGHAPG